MASRTYLKTIREYLRSENIGRPIVVETSEKRKIILNENDYLVPAFPFRGAVALNIKNEYIHKYYIRFRRSLVVFLVRS